MYNNKPILTKQLLAEMALVVRRSMPQSASSCLSEEAIIAMSENNQSATEATTSGSWLKRTGIAAVVLVAVFLLGYVPSCRSASAIEQQRAQLEQQLSSAATQRGQLEQQLQLARLHSQLGMASFEVNRNNYSQAATYSTSFFDGLGAAINTTSNTAMKDKLQAFIARRDEITAQLAQADPAVKEKIAQMYADFNQLVAAR